MNVDAAGLQFRLKYIPSNTNAVVIRCKHLQTKNKLVFIFKFDQIISLTNVIHAVLGKSVI